MGKNMQEDPCLFEALSFYILGIWGTFVYDAERMIQFPTGLL